MPAATRAERQTPGDDGHGVRGSHCCHPLSTAQLTHSRAPSTPTPPPPRRRPTGGAGAVRPGAPRLWTDRPGCGASDGAAGSASGAGATLRPSALAQDALAELTNVRLAASGLGVFIICPNRGCVHTRRRGPPGPRSPLYVNASRAGFPSRREMGLRFQASHRLDPTGVSASRPSQAGLSPGFSVPRSSHHAQLRITGPPEQQPPDPHQVGSPS